MITLYIVTVHCSVLPGGLAHHPGREAVRGHELGLPDRGGRALHAPHLRLQALLGGDPGHHPNIDGGSFNRSAGVDLIDVNSLVVVLAHSDAGQGVPQVRIGEHLSWGIDMI